MKRSLRRHIERAVNRSWSDNPARPAHGETSVLLVFPDEAFSDAPTWNPGQDFTECLERSSWIRDNPDGTVTAVVVGVGPMERPAADGGKWTELEVWTVTAPSTNWVMDSGALWDKPNRIHWTADDPQAVIHREPYATHPASVVDAYWEAFREKWGFEPSRMRNGRNALGRGNRWVLLTAYPGWNDDRDEGDLLNVTSTLARIFGAKARVYSYSRQRRTINDPVGGADSDLRYVKRRLAAALHL